MKKDKRANNNLQNTTQKTKDLQNTTQKTKDLQNTTQKTKDRATRTTLKPWGNSGTLEGKAAPAVFSLPVMIKVIQETPTYLLPSTWSGVLLLLFFCFFWGGVFCLCIVCVWFFFYICVLHRRCHSN